MLVSKKIYTAKRNYKYPLGYLYDYYNVKPLHMMLPKMTAYVKSYDGQTKWMCYFIEDDCLFEKHNTIWDKFSTDIKKRIR